MKNKIIQRILRETGNEQLFKILADDLSLSDLQSLMIEVYKHRAELLTPASVYRQFTINRFVQPAKYPPESMLKLEQLIYDLKPEGFEAIELSPVGPLGCCSVIGTVSQNKVLSTSRNTELVADATNIMALEAAKHRKELLKNNPGSLDSIKLCTSHRHIRTQQLEKPEHSAHFKIFCAITAGRDEGSFKFELDHLREHLIYHLSVLTDPAFRLEREKIKVGITNLNASITNEILDIKVLDPLRKAFPNVIFGSDPRRERGRGYYIDLCFSITLNIPRKGDLNIGDGGFTDWTQQYLSNKKERLIISALGTEMLLLLTDAFA